jgi:DNA-binding beta-propeller fold protein YncE
MRQLFYILCTLIGLTIGCDDEPTGIAPPLEELDFPISAATHPDGRYVYVANASFERIYRRGTIRVYDAHENRFLSRAVLEIDLFAGEVRLTRRGDSVVGLVTSRDTDSLTQFIVNADAGDSVDHFGTVESHSTFGGQAFAGDPFALALDGDTVMVTHLSRGIVSRWRYADSQSRELSYECSVNLPGTVSHVAKHPVADMWYVTDRAGSRINVLSARPLAEGSSALAFGSCQLDLVGAINVKSITSRGLAFSRDGTRLYVASQTDDSLRVYDVSIGYGGRPRNTLVKAIPVGKDPAVVRVAPCQGACEAGQRSLVYVSVFGDGHVVVVDPDSFYVVARVDAGDTPHGIAFVSNSEGQLRALVTNFEDAAVSVLDIDQDSTERFTNQGAVQ